MKILPKFIYLFRCIPLRIKNSFFKCLDGILSSYIWGFKKARRAISLIKLPYIQGGLDMPDFKLYFWASFFGRLRCLIRPINDYFAYTFMLGNDSNKFLFRTIDPNYFKRVKFKTACDIVDIWRNILSRCKTSFFYNKLPLYGNPGLPKLFHDAVFKQWFNKGITTLGDLYGSQGFLKFESLQNLYKITPTRWFKYLQVHNYLVHNLNLNVALDHPIWECLHSDNNN